MITRPTLVFVLITGTAAVDRWRRHRPAGERRSPCVGLPRPPACRVRGRCFARDPAPPWQDPFIIGFAGRRSVVSLTVAPSIPRVLDGAPFPGRAFLFAALSAILVTLVGRAWRCLGRSGGWG